MLTSPCQLMGRKRPGRAPGKKAFHDLPVGGAFNHLHPRSAFEEIAGAFCLHRSTAFYKSNDKLQQNIDIVSKGSGKSKQTFAGATGTSSSGLLRPSQ